MNLKFPRVLQKDFTVNSFDVGPKSTITPVALCRYLQEIAGLHAHVLNVSTDELHESGKTWVLREMSASVELSARWRDSILIRTWPTTLSSGVRAYRDFQIFDNDQNLIGVATSMWLMLDRKTFKPLRIPDSILAFGSPPLESESLTHFELNSYEASAAQIAKHFAVRLCDLDINQHVNNVSYVQVALEAIDVQRFEHQHLSKFQIKFLAEAKFGDTIISESRATEDVVEHQLRIADDNTIAALMRSEWQHDQN